MLIKITHGTYGYRDDRGRLRPKHEGEAVEVSTGEAKRLIKMGIAEASEKPSENVAEDSTENTAEAITEAPDESGTDIEDMSIKQLTEAAKQMGINIAHLRSKKALIEAITAASVELPEA